MMLNIRKANLADSSLLHELGFEIYSAHFKNLWVSQSEMNDYMAHEYSTAVLELSIKDPRVCWYIAETDHPVGFAKITWESKIPDTEISGALLNKLYLASDVTGRNYGKIIFQHLVSLARKKGADFLWLEVLKQNDRARNFYENLGFRYIKDTTLQTASQQSILHIMGITL
ncbi:GNAT family N-acetyltransferase [Pectobacterium aroidearum]|uniref:GNAT family N-acetyltransferase n=1 Tax=Pectobacterium aroidearum TaxID=1201031 RepID=UPI00315803C5